jgi:hypothetical protein
MPSSESALDNYSKLSNAAPGSSHSCSFSTQKRPASPTGGAYPQSSKKVRSFHPQDQQQQRQLSTTSSPSFYPYAPSAWADTGMTSPDAAQHVPGITNTIHCPSMSASHSLPNQANNYAPSGRKLTCAQTRIVPCTSAQVVVLNPTEPSIALVLRTLSPSTPYKVEVWDQALHAANLLLNSWIRQLESDVRN